MLSNKQTLNKYLYNLVMKIYIYTFFENFSDEDIQNLEVFKIVINNIGESLKHLHSLQIILQYNHQH